MSIVIIGEWPDVQAEREGKPIAGPAARELSRMLHEAGILETECDFLNIYPTRPRYPDGRDIYLKDTPANRIPSEQLQRGIERVANHLDSTNPDVVITLGDAALWGVTGERGITKWRGSLLDQRNPDGSTRWVIPTYAPGAILRKWDWRSVAVHDLQRAARQARDPVQVPTYHFTIRPRFEEVLEILDALIEAAVEQPPLRLSVDIETRARHIACIGLGWSHRDALCIPLMCVENHDGYWTLDEETTIVHKLSHLLSLEGVEVVGQNFLYDLQYLARHWGIAPIPSFDTMLAHAVCWPGTPKGLDYLSSLYCEYHKYWKDESKDWDPKLGEEQLWEYNCKDCVTTFEVSEALDALIDRLDLRAPFQFEMDLVEPLLFMMLRGTRIDKSLRDTLMWELQNAITDREEYFERLVPDLRLAKSKTAKPWYRSPSQLQKLFYEVFGQKVIRQRKTGRPTTDDAALEKIGKREPLLYPLTSVLTEYRSVGVFLSTFIRAPLDHDGRMRCSYNPVGTETFRFNSSADAFGYGTNLQNIPKGDD